MPMQKPDTRQNRGAMPKTFCVHTLGCKVSQYESEAIAESFEALGFTRVSDEAPCDVTVINTCTVTAESDRKSRQIIRRAITANPGTLVMVTGCYSQVSPQEVAAIPGVGFVCGSDGKMLLARQAVRLLEQKSDARPILPEVCRAEMENAAFEPMSIRHAPRTRAYVKIEDGCECRCAYCIIPQARGRVRSKSEEDVVNEVRALVAGGTREVVLTGIETGSYGRDTGSSLLQLLARLDNIEGLERIRMGSLDPYIINDEFVSGIAGIYHAAPHFHFSMQSGSDDVLKAMRRRYLSGQALERLEKLRAVLPDVQFTTDMLLGFPGETDRNFEETVEFARRARFLFMHIFPYSRRKNTVAASMPDQIPEALKHQRCAELAQVRDEIRASIHAAQIGREMPVLFETHENGVSVGHTANFLEIRVPGAPALHGEIRPVKIVASDSDACTAILLP